MKKQILAIILPISFVLLAFTPFFSFGSWELELNLDGIKVFTRVVEGRKLKDSKAEVVINASIQEIKTVLEDVPRFCEWMHQCHKSKLLKQQSNTAYMVYSVVDVPWPIADRDNVTQVNISTLRDGTVHFEMKAVTDFYEAQKDLVRINDYEGSWDLIPLENGKTKVSFFTRADPGGYIPNWLANMTVKENPYHTLKNLKEKLEG